jgi:hypothetical protein
VVKFEGCQLKTPTMQHRTDTANLPLHGGHVPKWPTAPGLKKFLETTIAELEERYAKVGALLNHRYFTQ